MSGREFVLGIGLTMKARDLSDSPGLVLIRRTEPLFLRGDDLRRLDLKLSRVGSLTIQDGGTVMSLLIPVNTDTHRHTLDIDALSVINLLHFHLQNIKEPSIRSAGFRPQ